MSFQQAALRFPKLLAASANKCRTQGLLSIVRSACSEACMQSGLYSHRSIIRDSGRMLEQFHATVLVVPEE